ncbi:MAG: hypothetical protein PHI85_03925 [Victivallaceae bacterium]|nr:hypothetical protein [Victivallaceae bacterium]
MRTITVKEYDVGEIFEVDNSHYLTVPDEHCESCDLRGACRHPLADGALVCAGHRRRDQTPVSFRRLEKLTAEVFDHPGCPSWANYAAVNAGGVVVASAMRMRVVNDHWLADTDLFVRIGVMRDPAGWQSSQITRERPEEALTRKLHCRINKLREGIAAALESDRTAGLERARLLILRDLLERDAAEE